MDKITYTQFSFGADNLSEEQIDNIDELLNLALEAISLSIGVEFNKQPNGEITTVENFEIN